MNETQAIPVHTVHLPLPLEDKWQRERRAFLRLLPELLKSYRDKFVAIHQEQLVDSDEELIRLALRVYARFGNVPIYMDLVSLREQVPVHIPHYRVLDNQGSSRR